MIRLGVGALPEPERERGDRLATEPQHSFSPGENRPLMAAPNAGTPGRGVLPPSVAPLSLRGQGDNPERLPLPLDSAGVLALGQGAGADVGAMNPAVLLPAGRAAAVEEQFAFEEFAVHTRGSDAPARSARLLRRSFALWAPVRERPLSCPEALRFPFCLHAVTHSGEFGRTARPDIHACRRCSRCSRVW